MERDAIDPGVAIGDVRISADPAELDLDWIHAALSGRAYWALGRSRETVERSIASSLCFAAFDGDRQVGFARVVTDQTTFGWVCDVFVDAPDRRNRGRPAALRDQDAPGDPRRPRGVSAPWGLPGSGEPRALDGASAPSITLDGPRPSGVRRVGQTTAGRAGRSRFWPYPVTRRSIRAPDASSIAETGCHPSFGAPDKRRPRSDRGLRSGGFGLRPLLYSAGALPATVTAEPCPT